MGCALGAAVVFGVAVPAARAADPPPRPRIIFYGDSLLHEGRDRVQALLDARFRGAWDVQLRTFPGSSICGWFDDMRADHAQIVVLLFTGVWLGSGCENPISSHRAYPQSYFSDLQTAIRIWQAKGTKVVLLDWPHSCCVPDAPDRIWEGYQAIAARTGVVTLDPAAALYDPIDKIWPPAMPCLRPTEPGCDQSSGFVAVRDAPLAAHNIFGRGGGHLCPVQGILTPCPVYSSGIERYATAITRSVGDLMEATVPMTESPKALWR